MLLCPLRVPLSLVVWGNCEQDATLFDDQRCLSCCTCVVQLIDVVDCTFAPQGLAYQHKTELH